MKKKFKKKFMKKFKKKLKKNENKLYFSSANARVF